MRGGRLLVPLARSSERSAAWPHTRRRRYPQTQSRLSTYLGKDSLPLEYLKQPTDYYLPGAYAPL